MKTPVTATTLAAGLLLAFNSAAQDHSQHQMPAPTAQDHSSHQAQPESKPKAQPKVEASTPSKDHEATGHDAPAQETPAMDHAAMGHEMPVLETPAMDHAAMGHTMPRPADQPVTPIPAVTDEDRAAAAPPPSDHPAHDNTVQYFVLLDRLERFDVDDDNGLEWEGQAWIGTDLNKLWLRSEGERVASNLEDADLEVLYGRSVARWWDVVAGVRHHFEPGDSQDMAVLGVMGMAPYKFEVEASLYVGDSGYTGARLEIEYETLLTSRLILQPALEANFHGQDDRSHGNGSGLGTVEAGLRLRYEISRQFAPYIGVVRERAYGRTADFRREDGEDTNDTHIVAGIRIWF